MGNFIVSVVSLVTAIVVLFAFGSILALSYAALVLAVGHAVIGFTNIGEVIGDE